MFWSNVFQSFSNIQLRLPPIFNWGRIERKPGQSSWEVYPPTNIWTFAASCIEQNGHYLNLLVANLFQKLGIICKSCLPIMARKKTEFLQHWRGWIDLKWNGCTEDNALRVDCRVFSNEAEWEGNKHSRFNQLPFLSFFSVNVSFSLSSASFFFFICDFHWDIWFVFQHTLIWKKVMTLWGSDGLIFFL